MGVSGHPQERVEGSHPSACTRPREKAAAVQPVEKGQGVEQLEPKLSLKGRCKASGVRIGPWATVRRKRGCEPLRREARAEVELACRRAETFVALRAPILCQ